MMVIIAIIGIVLLPYYIDNSVWWYGLGKKRTHDVSRI